MKFSITDFFSKCDQIGRPYLYPLKTSAILKKSLLEKFIFLWGVRLAFPLKECTKYFNSYLKCCKKGLTDFALTGKQFRKHCFDDDISIKKMIGNRVKAIFHEVSTMKYFSLIFD